MRFSNGRVAKKFNFLFINSCYFLNNLVYRRELHGFVCSAFFSRGGAVVAHQAHNLKVDGSSPSPATCISLVRYVVLS